MTNALEMLKETPVPLGSQSGKKETWVAGVRGMNQTWRGSGLQAELKLFPKPCPESCPTGFLFGFRDSY